MSEEDRIRALEARVKDLEVRLRPLETHSAVTLTNHEYTIRRLDSIEKEVRGVASSLDHIAKWLAGIIGTALVGGFLAWVISGGMAI